MPTILPSLIMLACSLYSHVIVLKVNLHTLKFLTIIKVELRITISYLQQKLRIKLGSIFEIVSSFEVFRAQVGSSLGQI